MTEPTTELRILEALLFAATEPVTEAFLLERLPEGTEVGPLLERLSETYADRGVNLTRVAGKWAFRTAEDLAPHLTIEKKVQRRLSRAAVETLAVIAYHQPVTRAEVEEIRGVGVSKGSFDVLLEAGWIRPMGRRRTPGRPTTWGTSQNFLEEMGLNSLTDLPGLEELKGSGLLDTRPAGAIIRATAPEDTTLPDDDDEAEEGGAEEGDDLHEASDRSPEADPAMAPDAAAFEGSEIDTPSEDGSDFPPNRDTMQGPVSGASIAAE